MDTISKLKEYFAEMIVYKDSKKLSSLSGLKLPSFMRDWLLKKFEDDDGDFSTEDFISFTKRFIPKKEDWLSIKNKLVIEGAKVKFLTRVLIDIDIRTGGVSFSLPEFDLTNRDTIIDSYIWEECKEDLVSGKDTWGMVELSYRPSDDLEWEYSSSKKREGKIVLESFKTFCPYRIDLDEYKSIRNEFTIEEWIDVLLGAIDYNADGYQHKEEKLTVLTRLLPFVEKNLNLIELAPKGTGKSYLFGNISRFGWLSSGGQMTRAKMFYDLAKRRDGLISGSDYVCLDEIQTIKFPDEEEMRGALKGYLENGKYTVGNHEGSAEAGVVLCGNVSKQVMDQDGYGNMFTELPHVFHESALIDRFHGFIKGWKIPRLQDNMKVCGWALNSEYFCTILHELRSDISYSSIVDELILVEPNADIRDTKAIKRIATAYMKLLFPNVQSAEDIELIDFKQYCFDPARRMRYTIRYQLGLLDEEYKKEMAVYKIKGWEE